ncbi:transcription repressor OFP13-like [Arachis stenosperma]|uniref:transcription repressor OFP13-like n=1 Tax=Arachis stenosperma TaxID=217475 RepID=UPI0025ABD63D|nr:transcription repressor OFP13-like [Arachis stenosperma]
MGKKMKLPSLLKNTSASSSSSSSSSWAWPSCHQPKTHSFRATKEIFKTYFDATVTAMDTLLLNTSEDSFFTVSPDSTSFSTTSDDDYTPSTKDDSSLETVIRGLRHRSDRLFFDPDDGSSIIEAKSVTATGTAGASWSLPLFKDSVALSMESRDPYVDFRKSMEEMVEAHGVKDWEGLEALLGWYLKVNGKSNHGYIVGAFVDLLVSLTLASSSSSTTSSSDSPSSSSSYSPSSPLSFYSSSLSSSCVSCLEAEQEPQEVDDGDDNHTPPASSSSLLEQDKEKIKYEHVASSSSSSSSKV